MSVYNSKLMFANGTGLNVVAQGNFRYPEDPLKYFLNEYGINDLIFARGFELVLNKNGNAEIYSGDPILLDNGKAFAVVQTEEDVYTFAVYSNIDFTRVNWNNRRVTRAV